MDNEPRILFDRDHIYLCGRRAFVIGKQILVQLLGVVIIKALVEALWIYYPSV